MPRIEAVCEFCGNEFLAGDLLPPSKAKCPKCKSIGASVKNRPVRFGGGHKCFPCNKLYEGKGDKDRCPECNSKLVAQR